MLKEVSLAVLHYDHFLTLQLEYKLFWLRKFSWVSVLYYLNRYAAIVASVTMTVEMFVSLSDKVCQRSMAIKNHRSN